MLVGMTEPIKAPPDEFCLVFWKRLRVRIFCGMNIIIPYPRPSVIL